MTDRGIAALTTPPVGPSVDHDNFAKESSAMTRVFLAGAGFIAREHAAAATDARVLPDGVELHVADPNPAALSAFLAEFPSATAYDDARAMFAAAGNEGGIAVIATPPVAHADLALAALEAGLHVLCEKPLAMSTEEATRIAAAAHTAGLILDSCDSRFRDVRATRAVRELLAADRLGQPYHVTFVNVLRRARTGIDALTESGWFRDPRLSGGGVLMDWGPYDLAVLDEVLQPVRIEIRQAWAVSPSTGGPFSDASKAAEQHVGASMIATTADGRRVPISYERAAATHGAERSVVQIEGETGAVDWDWLDWTGDALRFTTDADGEPSTTVTTFDPPEVGFHGRPLARIARAVAEGAEPSEITRQSLFTFAWNRAILDAARDGTSTTLDRSTILPTPSGVR
jgi:predicted dehydrogenase